jgi:hypothetical protein
MIRREIPKY